MRAVSQTILSFFCTGLSLVVNGIAAAPAPSASSAPTVTIPSGVVVGMMATATSGASTTSSVVNYLGIPFAAVPTGSLRFAPPVTPTAWKSPVQATALPPACRQQFSGNAASSENTQKTFNNPGHVRPQESEDCLYLNIFAPMNASIENKKPVLFWIFGGNLDFGTGSLDYYNGSSFAAFQDVMVVTFNYRTNIFGFSGTNETALGEQNVGYLDQRMALAWVHDNIAAFGGDPDKVTIFGESAGAYSVKQLMANPPEPLPFRAAILESPAITTGVGAAAYGAVLAHYGCELVSSPLDCLREVDGLDMERFISNNSLSFYPSPDNVTQSFDVRPAILSKKFANVPIMIGHNADEGRIFTTELGIVPSNSTLEQAIAMLLPNNSTLKAAVVEAYKVLPLATFEIVSQVITDLIFGCTASSLSTFAAANGYDVWRYYYNASFPNLQIFPDVGAFHSSEIPQVWGTYDLQNYIADATSDQIALSKYMQTTWANFAKDPSKGPGWPRLSGDILTNKMGELGGRNPAGQTIISTNEIDYQCPLFDAVIAIEGY